LGEGVCCSALQGQNFAGAEGCSVMQSVAVSCSVLQYVAIHCSVLQFFPVCCSVFARFGGRCVAVVAGVVCFRSSVMQFDAV